MSGARISRTGMALSIDGGMRRTSNRRVSVGGIGFSFSNDSPSAWSLALSCATNAARWRLNTSYASSLSVKSRVGRTCFSAKIRSAASSKIFTYRAAFCVAMRMNHVASPLAAAPGASWRCASTSSKSTRSTRPSVPGMRSAMRPSAARYLYALRPCAS